MPAAPEIIQAGPDNRPIVPDRVAIPFIEGDGVGPDIWKTAVEVFNAAVTGGLPGETIDPLGRSSGGRKGLRPNGAVASG